MTDNNVQNTIEDAPAQAKEEEIIVQNPVESKSADGQSQESSSEDPNWKAFREARKKDRADREAAERRAKDKESEAIALKAALEAALDKRSVPTQQQSYYQESHQNEESEDERIEKKVMAAISAKEAQLLRQQQEREQQEYPQRLMNQYSDFNQVVTQENLDYLEYHYPEVTRSFQRLQNDYQKWEDVYKTMKRFVPNATTSKKEAAKAESNLMRPRSISSVGSSQTTDSTKPHHLSQDRKQANWDRMQKTLKGLS